MALKMKRDRMSYMVLWIIWLWSTCMGNKSAISDISRQGRYFDVCSYTNIIANIYVYIHANIYTNTYANIYANTYANIYANAYANIHANIHANI